MANNVENTENIKRAENISSTVEENVFDEMKNENTSSFPSPKDNSTSGEVDYESLSNRPVGESIKYVRESLDWANCNRRECPVI